MTAKERLLERVERHESGCWIFNGQRNQNGYGVLYVGFEDGKRLRQFAHRISYEQFVGPIPTDQRYEIHHTCHNPPCVNPAHLQCLTRSQHARLNEQSTRPTCPHGHPWTPENTRFNKHGHRTCRTCDREKQLAKRHAAGLKGGPGIQWKNKTHCPSGHPYSPENTYVSPAGGRQCRECRRETDRRYKQRQRRR